MTLSKKPTSMSAKCTDIVLDLDLPYNVHRSNVADIVTDIIKGVLHQRNQIPVSYDKLLQIVKTNKQNESRAPSSTNGHQVKIGVQDVTNTHSDRQKKKIEREKSRNQKKDSRFCAKAVTFIDGCEQMFSGLKEKINKDGNDISSIRLLLGATSVSTRAEYKIVFPNNFTQFPIENFRPGRYLFRSMVTNESIVELNRDKLPTTNLFIFVEFKSGKESCEENFSFIPTKQPRQTSTTTNSRRRAKCVTININSKLPAESHHPSCTTTPFPKIPSRPYGQDSLNSMAMEMCTPITTSVSRSTSVSVTSSMTSTVANNNVLLSTNVNGKRLRKFSGNLEQQSSASLDIKNGVIRRRHFSIDMVMTPCGKEAVAVSTAMETASCTPVDLGGGGSMELCTPAPSNRTKLLSGQTLLETYTQSGLKSSSRNARAESFDLMELCTPAPPPPILRSISDPLHSGINNSASRTSMELCTPANYQRKARHSSMELCTPYVARPVAVSRLKIADCSRKMEDLALACGTPDLPPAPEPPKEPAVPILQEAFWLKWPVGIKGLSEKL
eukprot:TRINITY_DN13191_c0_g1_i5.p1 TRINITY_DN13191_c0_g1~~TRINITY_DN13191_c0_g1_i5.p1  ORF type:complete len:582 (+),score=44.77 TRINITY_DN13191_c0_g1_i5:84-1748(+)